MHAYPCLREGRRKATQALRVVVAYDDGHVHVAPRRALPRGKRLHHPLEPADSGRRHHMQHAARDLLVIDFVCQKWGLREYFTTKHQQANFPTRRRRGR